MEKRDPSIEGLAVSLKRRDRVGANLTIHLEMETVQDALKHRVF
jgi:hypothetical protein